MKAKKPPAFSASSWSPRWWLCRADRQQQLPVQRLLPDRLLLHPLRRGLNFITGLTGQPMMGMAGVFALGSYTSAILTTKLGRSPPGARSPRCCWSACSSACCWAIRACASSGVYLSLTTIAFSEIVRILITNATDLTGGGTGIKDIPNYSLFGYEFASSQSKLLLLLVFAVLIALLAVRIIHSQAGAAASSPSATISKRCPPAASTLPSIKLIAFILATMIGCLAGALYAHLFNYINPDHLTTRRSRSNFVSHARHRRHGFDLRHVMLAKRGRGLSAGDPPLHSATTIDFAYSRRSSCSPSSC